MKTFIVLLAGVIFTVFILVVFTPFFRESGASFNATANAAVTNTTGTAGAAGWTLLPLLSTMWPLLMWVVPLGVFAAVAFVWIRSRNKR